MNNFSSPCRCDRCLISASPASATTSVKATVNGMVCAFCAQGIEKRISQMPATKAVFVDLKRKVVVVEAKDGQTLDPRRSPPRSPIGLRRDQGRDGGAVSRRDQGRRQGARSERRRHRRVADAASGRRWPACSPARARSSAARIPAMLVGAWRGRGAVLARAVVPQVVWLSEHKEELFIAAGLMLARKRAHPVAKQKRPLPNRPGPATCMPEDPTRVCARLRLQRARLPGGRLLRIPAAVVDRLRTQNASGCRRRSRRVARRRGRGCAARPGGPDSARSRP